MFEAFVLVCLMGDIETKKCLEAVDTEGPYKTQEECFKRVNEMIDGFIKTQLPYQPAAFRCTEIKEKEYLRT